MEKRISIPCLNLRYSNQLQEKKFSPFVVDRDRTSCTIYHIPYSQSDVILSLCHPSPSSVYLLKIQPSIRLYSFHKTARIYRQKRVVYHHEIKSIYH